VTIKSFSFKIRSSTAALTLRHLKKVSLFFSVGSLSYSDSSIDWFSCSVSNTYFDTPKSKRWVSTTVQAILVVLSRVDASFNRKSAARKLAFLFVLVVELCFLKVDCWIILHFPLFYWLFKEKFNISVTIGSGNVIFWALKEKAKFFVWIPSLCFYSGRLWRYSIWSLHCSILASKDSVFKAQFSFAITRLTVKCLTSKFAESQFVTRSSGVVPSFISLLTSPTEILSFELKSQFQGLAHGWFIGSACPDTIPLPPAAFFV